MLKPVPLALTAVMLALPVPEFVMVTFCVALLPTFTVPNATVAGVALMEPWPPVPLRATVALAVELPRLAAIETPPVALPPAVGVNLAVKMVLAPAAKE